MMAKVMESQRALLKVLMKEERKNFLMVSATEKMMKFLKAHEKA